MTNFIINNLFARRYWRGVAEVSLCLRLVFPVRVQHHGCFYLELEEPLGVYMHAAPRPPHALSPRLLCQTLQILGLVAHGYMIMTQISNVPMLS